VKVNKSILILLSTEPSRILETILSRCLRLNFSADSVRVLDPEQAVWLQQFSAAAAAEQKSLFGRYRLLDSLLQRLNGIRAQTDELLSARSPLEKYGEAEKDLREKWETELTAAIEAEYRRRRAEVLLLLQWWLRDIWLHTLAVGDTLLHLPQIAGFAHHHFSVQKEIVGERTETSVKPLNESDRIEEISRMLGGETITEATRHYALELLDRSGKKESEKLES